MNAILFKISVIILVSSHITECVELIGDTDLYTDTYYGISNCFSGYLWVADNKLIAPPLDRQNSTHWWAISRTAHTNATLYQMITKSGSYGNAPFNIRKESDGYIIIWNKAGPVYDVSTNGEHNICGHQCRSENNLSFHWKFTKLD